MKRLYFVFVVARWVADSATAQPLNDVNRLFALLFDCFIVLYFICILFVNFWTKDRAFVWEGPMWQLVYFNLILQVDFSLESLLLEVVSMFFCA